MLKCQRISTLLNTYSSTVLGLSMAPQVTLTSGLRSLAIRRGLGRNLVGEIRHDRCTVLFVNSATHSYFRKFERFTPDPQYPQADASARGSEGPVQVGYFNHVSKASKDFIMACMKIGISFTPDFNGPTGTNGVSRVSTTFPTFISSMSHWLRIFADK